MDKDLIHGEINDLYGMLSDVKVSAENGIRKCLTEMGINSLNLAHHIREGDYDIPYANVYDRHIECEYYEPISYVELGEKDIDVHYGGEISGITTTDELLVMNVLDLYTTIVDILGNEEEYVTEKDSEEE